MYQINKMMINISKAKMIYLFCYYYVYFFQDMIFKFLLSHFLSSTTQKFTLIIKFNLIFNNSCEYKYFYKVFLFFKLILKVIDISFGISIYIILVDCIINPFRNTMNYFIIRFIGLKSMQIDIRFSK